MTARKNVLRYLCFAVVTAFLAGFLAVGPSLSPQFADKAWAIGDGGSQGGGGGGGSTPAPTNDPTNDPTGDPTGGGGTTTDPTPTSPRPPAEYSLSGSSLVYSSGSISNEPPWINGDDLGGKNGNPTWYEAGRPCLNATKARATPGAAPRKAYGINWTDNAIITWKYGGEGWLPFYVGWRSTSWGPDCLWEPEGDYVTVQCPVSLGPTDFWGPWGPGVDVALKPNPAATQTGDYRNWHWYVSTVKLTEFGQKFGSVSGQSLVNLLSRCPDMNNTDYVDSVAVGLGYYTVFMQEKARTCHYLDVPGSDPRTGADWPDYYLGCSGTFPTGEPTKWTAGCATTGTSPGIKWVSGIHDPSYGPFNFAECVGVKDKWKCNTPAGSKITSPDLTVITAPTSTIQVPADGRFWSLYMPASKPTFIGSAWYVSTLTNRRTAQVIADGADPFDWSTSVTTFWSGQPIQGTTPKLSSEDFNVNDKTAVDFDQLLVDQWGKTTKFQALKPSLGNGKFTVFQRQWFDIYKDVPVPAFDPGSGTVAPVLKKTKIHLFCDSPKWPAQALRSRNTG